MNIHFHMLRAQNWAMSFVDPEFVLNKASATFFTPTRHDPRSWERQAEELGRRVRLKNGISAIVWGEGVPVLLMHGWEGRATQMAGFIEPLTRHGFQLIALDAPAHGHSVGQQSHPALFVESMFLAQQTFGDFYAVIGHSMGGGCAIYSALEGLKTEKVISIAGPANFKRVSKRFARFMGMTNRVAKSFVANVEKTVGIPFSKIDIAARGQDLKQNLLLVHDHDDVEIPIRDAQLLASSVPGAALFTTTGLGHRKIMRSSVMIDTVSDFVAYRGDRFIYEAI